MIGSHSGYAMTNYVAQAIVNVFAWDLDIQKAIDAPRMGSRNRPTELERMGHSVRIRAEASGLHGIMRAREGWAGGSEKRGSGAGE